MIVEFDPHPLQEGRKPLLFYGEWSIRACSAWNCNMRSAAGECERRAIHPTPPIDDLWQIVVQHAAISRRRDLNHPRHAKASDQ